MGFEENLQKSIFSQSSEKTFVDKILARKDVDRLRDLIKTPVWNREILAEILYTLSGNEQKLLNHSDYSRYFSLKYFVWVREFAKVIEEFYDYTDFLKEQEEKVAAGEETEGFELTPISKVMINNILKELEHSLKFLIDLLVRIDRTSLSLGAAGFREILTNKYEISYPEQAAILRNQEQKPGILSIRGK